MDLAPNNKQGIGFTAEHYFVSFDSTTTDTNPANIAARNKQVMSWRCLLHHITTVMRRGQSRASSVPRVGT